jgi:hypothetical protein
MRKISLIPYKVADGQEKTVAGKDGVTTVVKMPDVMYDIKGSLARVLFIPALQLDPRGLIENDRIARKIEDGTDQILLEETEYERLKTAIETHKGYAREDLEMVQRVMDAEEITVKEA